MNGASIYLLCSLSLFFLAHLKSAAVVVASAVVALQLGAADNSSGGGGRVDVSSLGRPARIGSTLLPVIKINDSDFVAPD